MAETRTGSLGLNLNVLVPAGTTTDARLPVIVVRLHPILTLGAPDADIRRTSSFLGVRVYMYTISAVTLRSNVPCRRFQLGF